MGDGASEAEFAAAGLAELGDDAPPYVQAIPFWQSYAGLTRYWDKRGSTVTSDRATSSRG